MLWIWNRPRQVRMMEIATKFPGAHLSMYRVFR